MSLLTLGDLRKPALDFTLSKLGAWKGGCLPLPWSDTITGVPSASYIAALKKALQAGVKVVRLPQRKVAKNMWPQEAAFDMAVVKAIKETLGDVADVTVCFANEIGIGGVGCLSIKPWSSTSPLYEKWKADYKANPNDPTLKTRWAEMFWAEVPFASPEGWIAPYLLEYWAYRRSQTSFNRLSTCAISFELNNPSQVTEVTTFLGDPNGQKLLNSCQYLGMNLYADLMKMSETPASSASRFKFKVERKVTFLRGYEELDGEKLMLTEFGMRSSCAPNTAVLADARELIARERLEFTNGTRVDVIDRKAFFTGMSSDSASNGCELWKADGTPVGREISV